MTGIVPVENEQSWPPQGSHPRRGRRVLKLLSLITLTCAAIAMTGLLLLPELTGAIWHLTHSNRLSVSGLTVKVPFAWTSNYSNGLLVIQRVARFDESQDSIAVFGPLRDAALLDTNTERIRGNEIHLMSERGYRFVDERSIRNGSISGICFKFISSAEPDISLVNCDSPSAKTRIEFKGGHSYESDFYALLENVK